jgi:hypothetical protein
MTSLLTKGYRQGDSPLTAITGTPFGIKRRGAVLFFRQNLIPEECCVTNGIPLGCSPILPVGTVNCVKTLKDVATIAVLRPTCSRICTAVPVQSTVWCFRCWNRVFFLVAWVQYVRRFHACW